MEPLVKCEVKKECTGDQRTFYEPTNEPVSLAPDSIQNTCPSEECRIAEDVVKMEYDEIEFKEEISSTYFNSEYKEYKTVIEPKLLVPDTVQNGAQNTYPYEEYNIESSAVDSLKTPVSCHRISEAFTKINGEKASRHTQKKSDSSSELCTMKDPEINNLNTHHTRGKFSFPQNCPLELHMPTGARDKYSPDVSIKTFTQKCSVKRHNMAPHTAQKPFSCDVCTKAFPKKSALKMHMLIHTGEKPFSCDVCAKAFAQKGYLKMHMFIHTGENSFSCDVCDKVFAQKSNLKRHMLTHTGEKSFSCDICTKAFTRKCDMKMHMLIHTGEKPFSCDVCTKAFTQKSTLKRHMLIHTGEKSFSCDICTNSFTRKCDMKMHMLIHTGEKPFSCDICAKSFNQRSNLKTHMLTHTGDKFFSRDICAKAFIQKGNLKMHNMSIHNSFSYDVCIKK